jgi:carboxymethylenebutenolidase
MRDMTEVATGELELGYFARAADGAHPGVIVIHDVWGLSDHYRDLARRLAAEGFSVLAANLYRRHPDAKITDPGRWIRGLSDPQLIGEMQTAVDFLASHASVGRRRVGVVGFCMGGSYAIHAAAGCRGLSAAVAFYGMLSHEHGLLAPEPGETLDPLRKPRSPLAAARDVRCPLLGCFGADDPYIPSEDVARLDQQLDASGQPHEVIVYSGAGHAFVNDTRPEMYRPEAARDAWSRMLAWFQRHLAS